MPKLRGIETRGKTDKNCLEPIQNLLDNKGFKIVEDFKHAREVGHGQFIWSSAYYLEDDESNTSEISPKVVKQNKNNDNKSEPTQE